MVLVLELAGNALGLAEVLLMDAVDKVIRTAVAIIAFDDVERMPARGDQALRHQ